MTKLRILISEGNELSDREIFTRHNGCAPSGMFEKLLHGLRSDLETEILLTTDVGQRPLRDLEDYDGILFTGSNSNIHKMTAGTWPTHEPTAPAYRTALARPIPNGTLSHTTAKFIMNSAAANS